MEESIFELAVNELLERQRLTKLELRERFKKTKPFRMEPVSEDEQLAEYMAMTPETMDERLQRDGIEATNAYIMQMEELKRRKGYA